MVTIESLEEIAENYRQENKISWMNGSQINSSLFIEMYLDWYLQSKILFSNYFDPNDPLLKEFSQYDTDGNGLTLGNQFSRQYPIFKELAKRIKSGSYKENQQNIKTEIFERDKMKEKKCFLIHGHDNNLKNEVARLIEKELKIEVVILHEQANKGKTVIEKFEANSAVDFAIALWTDDDEGKAKNEDKLKARARQNVILETGYFFGSLGRERVIVLNHPNVEIPSDYNGMVYISLKDNWKHDLLSEIKTIYEN